MGRSRLIGIYLTVVGIAVAAQFVLHPLYGTNSDVGINIWLALDWLMALGLILALYTTNQRRQMSKGDGASCCTTGADLMFYGTAILTLAFFPNWFGEAFTEHPSVDAAWTIWHLIDSVLPVVFIAEGRRLIRAS